MSDMNDASRVSTEALVAEAKRQMIRWADALALMDQDEEE